MLTRDRLEEMLGEGMPLHSIIKEGVRGVVEEVLSLEAQRFVEQNQELLGDGKRRLVLNGTHREREIQFPFGKLAIKAPRVKDNKPDGARLEFSSSVLPKYLRKSDDFTQIIPWLYLRGLPEMDFQTVFAALYGHEVRGGSPGSLYRLAGGWVEEYRTWTVRDMSREAYPYVWADGVFLRVRGESENACQLVALGLDAEGRKRLVGTREGFADSGDSWRDLFADLRGRGMPAPKLVIGDAGKGLWAGLGEVYPDCRRQSCWSRRIESVKRELPKAGQDSAILNLRKAYMSAGREEAASHIEAFNRVYGPKHPKAVAALTMGGEDLLTFFDYPAEHWPLLRTCDPIGSLFSTLRPRTSRPRGRMRRERLEGLVFKLIQSATGGLGAISGAELVKRVLSGERFVDGVGLGDGPERA